MKDLRRKASVKSGGAATACFRTGASLAGLRRRAHPSVGRGARENAGPGVP